MKRKLILLAVTIVFLAGFGALLHSPPSMIDAVTGATPKSKKAARTVYSYQWLTVFVFPA